MVAESVPRQLAKHTMVLVTVFTKVSEDEVGLDLAFQLFKEFFNFSELTGDKPISEFLQNDVLFGRAIEESAGAGTGFAAAFCGAAEHDPPNLQLRALAQELEDRSSATDLEIVGMSAETEDGFEVRERQLQHSGQDGPD